MSTTSENILKSLAVLEQNLKDIDSAKLQVSKVVKSSDDLAKVIETYQSSFDGVSKNLKTVLSEIKSVNLDTISNLSKQTELFNKEVNKLSNLDFETYFNSVKKEIIKQFENDLKNQLVVIDEHSKILQDEINEFKSQISRLESIDFKSHFTTLLDNVTKQNNEVKIQNKTLLKEIKKNRTLLIVGIVVIVGFVLLDIALKLI